MPTVVPVCFLSWPYVVYNLINNHHHICSAYDPHSSRGDRHRDDRARGHAGPPSSGGYDARGYPGYSSMGPPPAYGDRSRGYGGVERHSDYRSGGRAAGPYDRPRY